MGRLDIEQFVVLDLDRTLFNTDLFVEKLFEALLKLGVKKETVEACKKFANEQSGKQFDIVGYIVQTIPEVSLDLLKEEMLHGESRYAYEGTLELFAMFDERSMPYAILTVGSLVTQELKLELFFTELARTIPYEIIEATSRHPSKAKDIEAYWFQSDGYFAVPPQLTADGSQYRARQIIILDDKPSNLVTTVPHIVSVLVSHEKGQELHDVMSSGIFD